ncbi:hypothetical protein JK359_16750 [Streptomyces actinomycinicus]|uniref:Uncharacterized protein n=1 Tax=Streptomyces actinomycinicus TaxID=1695166 RepID=A0A937EK84_9ACTN|nr:hypothetical protein [Streptomyces actinomycinicus]MBL1083600.1 hypothetical protein [Streptomyces actinomycinicus]
MFAQLKGAYWLSEPDAAECRWCNDLFSQPSARKPAGTERKLSDRMLRLRMAMLPVAVLTVAAAVLVGMLG